AARFLHSCVLLDLINALEVSSLELRRIGKLQEFYRNLCAESVLNEGPEIRDLWDKLLSTLHIATSQAQLLHSNGIWETNLLLNEYKSFMRPNMFSGVTVNAIITSFATVLQHFLLVSNNLTDTIQAAILSHQTLQAQILKAHKRLSIETKQQGFLQYCLNLLLGNAWLMRRESELSTMSKASSIVESIAPSIHDIKIRNERYNNNVVTLSFSLTSMSTTGYASSTNTSSNELALSSSEYYSCSDGTAISSTENSSPLSIPVLSLTDYSSTNSESSFHSNSFNLPDPGLQIPGEVILCKSKANGEYWPAVIKAFVGVQTPRCSRKGNQPTFQKVYLVQFCDETISEVPQSFFWTTAHREFHVVEMGRIHTTEITFKKIYPRLLNIMPELDLISSGNAREPTVKERHEHFLQAPIGQHALLGENVLYGQYSDNLLFDVAQFLSNRYFLNATQRLEPLDPRVLQLCDHGRTSYVSDVLLPEAILLITMEEVNEEAPNHPINLRERAMDCLKETDIVDLVNCLHNNPPKNI
ncbi:hypothetical protein MJO28_005650, partial [Puccinia striiformis f. sp. tritici]